MNTRFTTVTGFSSPRFGKYKESERVAVGQIAADSYGGRYKVIRLEAPLKCEMGGGTYYGEPLNVTYLTIKKPSFPLKPDVYYEGEKKLPVNEFKERFYLPVTV